MAPRPAQLAAVFETGLRSGDGDDWLRLCNVKLLADGSLGAQTAYLRQPYRDGPDSRGIPVYTQEELDTILALHPIYTPAVIPAGTYSGQRADIQTFGVKALLCVNASMDKELVRSLTQALWESREALAQEHPAMADMTRDEFLYEDLPIPLHEGAEDFYNSLSS